MGFGSFFKKKKKEAEKSVNDVDNMIKTEIQPEKELEKIDHSFTAEEGPGNAKKASVEANQSQADEDNRLESSRSANSDAQKTFKEVTVNIDSELLRKAQAEGIDLSNTLEQQLKRMLSGT